MGACSSPGLPLAALTSVLGTHTSAPRGEGCPRLSPGPPGPTAGFSPAAVSEQ